MELLLRTRNTDVDEIRIKKLTNKRLRQNLQENVEWEVQTFILMMISTLDENHSKQKRKEQ